MAANYCQVSDVLAQAPQLTIDGTSKPSSTIVQAWIGDIGSEVEARLTNCGYTVPVTLAASPNAFRTVKTIVVWGVLSKVLAAKILGAAGDPDIKPAAFAEKKYQDYLKQLSDVDSTLELKDALRTGTEVLKAGDDRALNSLFSDDADVEAEDRTITRDQVF